MSSEEASGYFYEIDERTGDNLIDELVVLITQRNHVEKLHISMTEMGAAEWAVVALVIASSQLSELVIHCERRCHVAHMSLLIAGLRSNRTLTLVNLNRVKTIEPLPSFLANFKLALSSRLVALRLQINQRTYVCGSSNQVDF